MTPDVWKVTLQILILKDHIKEIFGFRVGLVPLPAFWDNYLGPIPLNLSLGTEGARRILVSFLLVLWLLDATAFPSLCELDMATCNRHKAYQL